MIILFTSFIVAALACKSVNEVEYIDIGDGESQQLCFKVDTKLPTVLQLVKYQKKKSKKSNDEDNSEAIFFDEISIGSCQLIQDERICYFDAGKEKQDLSLKCSKGPCKFGVQALQESIQELKIGKLAKSKLKIFNIEKDDSYRIIYQIKCENCIMELVDAQLAVFGDESTIVKSDTRFVILFNDGINKNTKLVLIGTQEFDVQVWKYDQKQQLDLNHLSIDGISGKTKNIYEFKESGIIKIKQLQNELIKVRVRNDKQEVKLDNSFNSQNFRNYLIVWSNSIYKTLELSAVFGLSYQIEIINPSVIEIEGSQLVVGEFNGVTNYQLKILKNKNNYFAVSVDGDSDTQVQVEECNKKCKKFESITSGKSYFSVKQNCDSEDDDGYCYFSVGVMSTGKFSLSINENNEPIRLESNQLRISEIEEEGKHHYTYSVVDSEKLHSITFRVTSPNVQMLVSKTSKCKLVDLKCKQFSGTSGLPIRITDLKDGTYSITIEGMELTKYGIIVETELEEGINLLELQLGQVYSSSLNTKQDKQCFKYEQKGKNVVTFLVHGPNHKLQSYAYIDTIDEIPTPEDHDLLSTTQALQLATEQFVACVQVVKWAFAPSINKSLTNYTEEQEWMQSKYYSDIKYSVVLYNANSVINLEFNEAYYGQIAFTESQSFSFLTYFDQDIIFITKSILSSSDATKDLQIYVGNILHEKLTEYEYNFFDNNSTTFVLDSKKMKSLCDITDEKHIQFEGDQITQPCEIFLLVKSNSKTPVRYTLTIHKQDLAIQLTDGLQLSYNLQHIDTYMHFYYQPSNQFQDISIMASTFFGKFIMHMNVWKNDDQLHKYDWPFMDNDTSYLSSGATNSIHRTIKSDALSQCFPDCLVLLSVQNIETADYGDFINNDQFHIMANQGMQDIVEEQKYEVSVQYEQTVYFTFKNLQKFRDDAVLTFSLLSLIGNGYLQVTVNGGAKIEYPSLFGPYDFHSDGNYLQITKDQLNSVLQSKEISIQEAYLIIAVGGIQSYINEHQKNMKLELTTHYMNMDYIQIMHASPHVVHTTINKPSIVQFYNYQNEDIFIKLHKLVGYGQMSVFICNSKSTVADCVTESNQEGFQYLGQVTTAGSENSQILISKTDKSKFCVQCTYIIKLMAIANDMHAQLTIVMENDFVRLPAGLQYSDYVEPNQQSQYTVLFTEDSKVDIVIQILNGNPMVYYSYYQEDIGTKKAIKAEKNSSYIHITIPSQRLVNNIADAFLDEDETALKSSHFMHDELFVRIKTKSAESCNYTIYYTTDLINGKLQDGKIHLAVFEVNNTFLYENNVEEYSILNLSPFNITSLKDIDIQVAYVKKQSFEDYHIENVENVTLKTRQIHPLQSSYELPKNKGLYEITLINKQYIPDQINSLQQVEISVTSQDIKILPFKKHYSGYAQPDAVEYFETLAPKSGFIAVEIYTCQGDVTLGYSKSSKSDLNSFIREDYDVEFQVEENYYHVELITVEKGTVWMAVHDTSSIDAYYHISNFFYQNEKDIPFGKILPGGDGNIKWNIDKQKADSIQIEFEHVSCPKCNLNNVQVNYHIFIAQDIRKLRMLGYCRNEEFENHKATNEEIFKREPIQSYRIADHNGSIVYEIEFPNLVTYEYAVIGVMATVENFMNSTTELKLFYRSAQVPVPNYLAKIMNKNRTFFTFVVVGMIFLIALLTLWLCYYIKRYRRTQHQLDFQLQEGAKIIAASKLPQHDDAAFQNNITMKYDTLEED